MDRSVRIELDAIYKRIEALSADLVQRDAQLLAMAQLVDKLCKADDTIEARTRGLYVPASKRAKAIRVALSSLCNIDEPYFTAIDLRRACGFAIGVYIRGLVDSGEVLRVERGYYKVTDKFFKLNRGANEHNR